MQFTLSALVASAIFGSSIAVNVVIYPNSAVCDGSDGTGLECSNVAALTCCHNNGGDIYSSKCSGLDTTGVPDQCVIATGAGPGVAYCTTSLEVDSGASIICLDPGSSPAATGGFWVDLSSKKRFRRGSEVQCTKSVQPNKALFGDRSFRINYDVPANITDYLLGLIKTDPSLSKEIPGDVQQYEVTN
ncbi:hypothetical protein F5Y16DRAFT_401627 [Xylariaceae sp. FL0255]|nr:hypothetical protein F5Y16DRAFT_401627 [Xylariaceae sp. FL0255]